VTATAAAPAYGNSGTAPLLVVDKELVLAEVVLVEAVAVCDSVVETDVFEL
jgi:hypothetical protein